MKRLENTLCSCREARGGESCRSPPGEPTPGEGRHQGRGRAAPTAPHSPRGSPWQGRPAPAEPPRRLPQRPQHVEGEAALLGAAPGPGPGPAAGGQHGGGRLGGLRAAAVKEWRRSWGRPPAIRPRHPCGARPGPTASVGVRSGARERRVAADGCAGGTALAAGARSGE